MQRILLFSILILVTTTLVLGTPLWERQRQVNLQSSIKANAEDYRLPTNLKPLEYDVRLIPFLETPAVRNFTFEGNIMILFNVISTTNIIQMHAYDIYVDNTTVKVSHIDGTIIEVTKVELTPNTDNRNFLTITLNNDMTLNNNYRIEMRFTGKINEDLEGLYRSSYVDSSGNKKWLAVTQFAAVGARRAFPCFDEPEMKAQFAFQIAHEPGYKVLANMLADEEEIPMTEIPGITGWFYTRFPKSLLMSTYLIAFSINQYESITNGKDDRFKVWSQPDRISQGLIANELAPKIVSEMEYFTRIKYPTVTGMKIDQIAIPDMNFQGMENWGLITYRDSSLLYERGISPTSRLQSIETIVTHELIHQWFGNLVTPKWWSHFWLNEGFATYFEYSTLARIQPTWRLEEQFIYDQMYSVLTFDAQDSTHPIVVPNVVTPAETNAVFDSIAYNKGACMVRMLIYLMGYDNFRAGISQHLQMRQYQAVDTNDLWVRLSTHVPPNVLPSRVTLRNVMDTWTLQSGYPVIMATRNYTSNTTLISQRRFITSPIPGVIYPERWIIPLTIASSKSPNFDDVSIDAWHQGQNIRINAPDKNDWILINKKQMGYYRVNYDDTNWKLVTAALHGNMKQFDVINRAQLLDDSLALALASQLNYERALDIAEYLSHETEYLPWAAALKGFTHLKDRMNFNSDAREHFEWFVQQLIDHVYNMMNGISENSDDSHILKLKRTLIAPWACNMGHMECNKDATTSFKQWTEQIDPDLNNHISPDLKSIVYCTGIKNGDKNYYDFLFTRYNNSGHITNEQITIVSALGCSSDVKLLQNYLNASINENSIIQGRDVFTTVYNNHVGVDLALDFIINNWKIAIDFYGGNEGVGLAFTGISTKLNTVKHLNKLKSFLTSNEEELGATKTHVENAIKTVEETIEWHEKHQDIVIDYLRVKRGTNNAPLVLVSPVILIISLFISNYLIL